MCESPITQPKHHLKQRCFSDISREISAFYEALAAALKLHFMYPQLPTYSYEILSIMSGRATDMSEKRKRSTSPYMVRLNLFSYFALCLNDINN